MWEEVLIDWVNCLKLSEPIKALNCLQGQNEFIDNMSKLLLNLPRTGKEESGNDLLSLLKTQFLRFKFEPWPSSIDVNFISLLMHYSCISDGRPIFTSPLCENLSPKTQVIIKHFLEKVNPNVTNRELTEIINECVIKMGEITDNAHHWVPSVGGDSPRSSSSPLQLLLRGTPLSRRNRVQEDEIFELRSELETERNETTKLQKELKSQFEINAKLEKQLAQQKKEMECLKSEIASLDSATTPNKQSADSVQTQKILKTEIESLEQYIAQQQAEFDLLNTEKTKATKKVKKMERECQIWQQRALAAESNSESMMEQLLNKDQEIRNLQIQCKDLNDMIEGIKYGERNDTSRILESSDCVGESNSKILEDLAHTVVDVQLKEMEKENVTLKMTLEDNLWKSEMLAQDLTIVQENLEAANLQLSAFKEDNEQLRNKLGNLQTVETEVIQIRRALENSFRQVAMYEEEHDKYEKEISDLRIQLKNCIGNLEEKEKMLISLTEDLNRLTEENTRNKLLVREGNAAYQRLKEEANILQQQHNTLISNYNQTCFELETIKKTLEEFKTQIESNLNILKAIILRGTFESNEEQFSDVRFQNVLQQIVSLRAIDIKDKRLLTEKIELCEETIRKLDEKAASLEEKEMLVLDERDALKASICNAERIRSELNASIAKYCSDIDSLKSIIREMEATIVNLTDKVKNRDDELMAVSSRNSELTSRLENARATILNMEDEKTKTRDVVADLRKLTADLERKLNVSNQVIQDYENRETNMSADIKELKDFKISLEEQLTNALNQLDESRNNLAERKKVELDHLEIINHLNVQNEVYSKDLSRTEEELRIANRELGNVSENLEKVISQKESSEKALQEKVTYYQNNIHVLEVTINRLEKDNHEMNMEIENLKMNNNNVKLQLEESKTSLENSKSNFKLLSENLKTSEDLVCLKNSKIDELNTEIELLKECKHSFELKYRELEDANRIVVEKLTGEKATLECVSAEYLVKISDLTKRKDELEMKIESNDETMATLTCRNNHMDKQVKNLRSELGKLNREMEILNLKEIEKLKEIDHLKDELNKTVDTYTKSLEENQELRCEYEIQIRDLQENLHNIVEKYNVTEKMYLDANKKLDEIQNRTDELESAKSSLEKQLTQQQQQHRDSCSKYELVINEYEREKCRLSQMIQRANADVECLKEQSNAKVSELESTLRLKNEEKDILQKELSDAIQELFNLNEMHKKYVAESRDHLRDVEGDLHNQIQLVRTEKELLESSVDRQKTKIKEITEEKDRLIHDYTFALERKEETCAEMALTLAESENKMGLLEEKRKDFEEQSRNWQKLYEEAMKNNENSTTEYRKSILSSKCALEVLQTGKQILEDEHRDIVEELKRTTEELIRTKNERDHISIEKENAIASLTKQLEQTVAELSAKEEDISALNKKFDAVSSAMDALRLEQAQLENAWKLERAKFEGEYFCLKKAHQNENNLYIKLKEDHEALADQLGAVKREKVELEDQMCNLIREEEILKNAIKDYESAFAETSQQLDTLKLILRNTESTVLDLNDKIEKRLKNLITLELDKRHVENEIADVRTNLQEAMQHRDQLLDVQSTNAKATENYIMKIHENINEILKISDVLQVDKRKLEDSLRKEIDCKELLEKRILELEDERHKFVRQYTLIDRRIKNLIHIVEGKPVGSTAAGDNHQHLDLSTVENITVVLEDIERRLVDTFEQKRLCEAIQKKTAAKMEALIKENEQLASEKDKLESLAKEKHKLSSSIKTDKENTLQPTNVNVVINSEDDWKKKYFLLKQRLALSENIKQNLEAKLQKLRDSNKLLSNNDEYITNEEHETIIESVRSKYEELKGEHEELLQKLSVSYESNLQSRSELECMRKAYANVASEKFQLEQQLATYKKELEGLVSIKEAYERLLEEHNKLLTEIDTLNYKRNRDREELTRLLKEDRESSEKKHLAKIQEIRSEYEGKLEKMKDKMIKLYKDEMDREMQKHSAEKNENMFLHRTIETLKEHLKSSNLRAHEAEHERDRLRDSILQLSRHQSTKMSEPYDSRESMYSQKIGVQTLSEINRENFHPGLPTGPRNNFVRESVDTRLTNDGITITNDGALVVHRADENKKFATLPRSNRTDYIEEITICRRRTSINSLPSKIGGNLKMEDEEDDFNNKYLSDLKAGRCIMPSGQENTENRVSELVWRNSLCPPHLKSSYPAEMQFISPGRFQEEEIKSGNVNGCDSASVPRLFPNEKQSRNKKDAGTTSYKKPGPPTPSKNGGRPSLQSNEPKTPKRSTPNRLRALFMGRNASQKDNSEAHQTTPRSKRLNNIFRKPH